jgi:hypothetical protein
MFGFGPIFLAYRVKGSLPGYFWLVVWTLHDMFRIFTMLLTTHADIYHQGLNDRYTLKGTCMHNPFIHIGLLHSLY